MEENDSITNYTDRVCPNFSGKKAFVLSGAMAGQVVALMAAAGFTKADSVEDADLVVFTGGADVDPALYGQKPIAGVYPTRNRDNKEIEVFEAAKEAGVPMFGICRGSQFLHVMAGGELWQDVTGHAGPDHFIVDIQEGCRVMATSLHHQAVKPTEDINMQVVAVSEDEITSKFEDENILLHTGALNNATDSLLNLEVEAVYYPEINAFTVQGHPEVGSNEYRSWTLTKLMEYCFEEEDEDDDEETEPMTITVEEGNT